jgi:hypothetical protein
MSLFDSSLQQNFHIASKEGANYDLRKIFDETLTFLNLTHSVTVVDNHDMQPLQDLEAPVEKWFKPLAYALIFKELNIVKETLKILKDKISRIFRIKFAIQFKKKKNYYEYI